MVKFKSLTNGQVSSRDAQPNDPHNQLDDLLNIVKNKIKSKEFYEKLDNSKFDSFSFKRNFSQMIIDSFARILNDDKVNIVTSAQFFQKINNYNNKNDLEIINISANYVDNNLINRSISLIRNAKELQLYPEQLKHPNKYIFNNLAIEKLKYLNNIVSMLLEAIETIIENTGFQQEYNFKIKDLRVNDEKILKNLSSSKINEQLIIDRLNLFMEFVYYVLYLKFSQVYFSVINEDNLERFVVFFLIFLENVWDKYSVFVLSQQYFEFRNVKIACRNELFDIGQYDKKINIVKENTEQNENIQLHSELNLLKNNKSFQHLRISNDYIGVSKLCCPMCSHTLLCLGHRFHGSHNSFKPAIDNWNAPDFIDKNKKQCLFNFLKSKIEQQNIEDLYIVSTTKNEKKCNHGEDEMDELSHFDRLLIKKRSDCDNIRQFKTTIGKDLPIHQFEWVFDIHSFLEKQYLV